MSNKKCVHDIYQIKFLETKEACYYITQKLTIVKKNKIQQGKDSINYKLASAELNEEDYKLLKDCSPEQLKWKYLTLPEMCREEMFKVDTNAEMKKIEIKYKNILNNI